MTHQINIGQPTAIRMDEPYAGLKRLGERLLNEQVDTGTVDQLEALARRLELDRAEIGRRLRPG